MEDMTTQVDEIATGIYRLSTYTEAVPGGFTFNQFVVAGEEPLLFHTGLRHPVPQRLSSACQGRTPRTLAVGELRSLGGR